MTRTTITQGVETQSSTQKKKKKKKNTFLFQEPLHFLVYKNVCNFCNLD